MSRDRNGQTDSARPTEKLRTRYHCLSKGILSQPTIEY